MTLLLDTHAFVWWLTKPKRLSGKAHDAISNPANTILASAAAAWELAIKTSIGKLDLPDDVAQYVPDRIASNGFEALPASVDHAVRVASLPHHHRDPFDRLLVAQALAEDIQLVSVDPLVRRYEARIFW